MTMTIGCPIPGASQPKEPVRLIDANKVMDALDDAEIKLSQSEYENFQKEIDKISTIDPESLRPMATWGDDKNSPFYVCSACYSASFTRSKFCKECGAKMTNPKKYEKVTQQGE